MNFLILDVKKKIREVTEEVVNKVGDGNFVVKIFGNGNVFDNVKMLFLLF